MDGGFERALEKYGQRVTVRRGETETETRAFLQPIAGRGEGWDQELPTPLGMMKRGRWLYLGGPAVSLEDAGTARVLWRGHVFRVRAAQPVWVGERLSHWRAVLDERDGETE